jgi:hypothetical protein
VRWFRIGITGRQLRVWLSHYGSVSPTHRPQSPSSRFVRRGATAPIPLRERSRKPCSELWPGSQPPSDLHRYHSKLYITFYESKLIISEAFTRNGNRRLRPPQSVRRCWVRSRLLTIPALVSSHCGLYSEGRGKHYVIAVVIRCSVNFETGGALPSKIAADADAGSNLEWAS